MLNDKSYTACQNNVRCMKFKLCIIILMRVHANDEFTHVCSNFVMYMYVYDSFFSRLL